MGSVGAVLTVGRTADVDVAKRMLKAAPHRGAQWDVLSHGYCALAISNPVEPQDATLASVNGLAAALVGDIDNAPELARRFLPGDPLQTTLSPARLLLALFQALGDHAPIVMRGAFAGIITDGSRLWCFRDHLGIGQLFYRQDRDAFYVATEAKQVLAGAGVGLEPDVDVVERMFFGDVDHDIGCALKGVSRIPRSHIVAVSTQGLRAQRYWDPEALLETSRLSPEEIRGGFEELMRQAASRALSGSDLISLSGGVDSPAVAAFAAPEHLARFGRPIAALTGVYPDYPTVDEQRYVEAISSALGIELHTYRPSAHPLDGIDEWTRVCDGPVPVMNAAEMAEHYHHARGLGFTRMLGGHDAEFVMDRREHFAAYLLLTGKWSALRRHVVQERAEGVPWRRIGRGLAASLAPRPILTLYERRWSSYAALPAWLDATRLRRVNAAYIIPARRRWAESQLALAHAAGIGFEAADVCQAVCGIRLCHPWADVDLYEFFLSLPADVKFPNLRRKTLVRSLLRGKLPDVVLDRRDKTYFNDFFMSRIDYKAFRRWLGRPNYRIEGVNYELLNHRLEQQDFDVGEYKWALDLAKTHAFLSHW